MPKKTVPSKDKYLYISVYWLNASARGGGL